MNLIEPTKCELQAAAGWTLIKRQSVAPAHALALDQFRDGCVALAEHADETRRGAAVQQDSPAKLPSLPQPRASVQSLPDDVLDVIEALGTRTCRNGGRHRFGVRDRKCKYCGQSYMDVKGRQPELMR